MDKIYIDIYVCVCVNLVIMDCLSYKLTKKK
jgi:hypothetical protein